MFDLSYKPAAQWLPTKLGVGSPQSTTAAASARSHGSLRRRLWDLPGPCHCPVIGVCLPLEPLRRLVQKWIDSSEASNDFMIHVRAVNECSQRNPLSESIQRALDDRHAAALREFRTARTSSALVEQWHAAVSKGNLAGPLWAALTHPQCDTQVETMIIQDIHMAQHQAGAHARVDQVRFADIVKENSVLTRELGRIQQRISALVAERARELELLLHDQAKFQTDLAARESTINQLRQELTRYQDDTPDLDARISLKQQLSQALESQRQWQRRCELLAASAGNAADKVNDKGGDKATDKRLTLPAYPQSAQSAQFTQPAASNSVALAQKMVLCVGGRTSSVSRYRETIEDFGGQFQYHDGGIEQSQQALEANLAAADLVICQTGCISHNAYWRVKDHCKRTGKRCVFVENPSPASLAVRLHSLLHDQ